MTRFSSSVPSRGPSRCGRPPYDEFVFNLRASYKDETHGLVNHFVDIGRTKIAVFYQIDAYGRTGWEGVRSALADHDPPLAIAAEATYRRGAEFKDSMKQQVDILRAADPDAVICIGAYAACAAFIRDARDARWDVPIANVSFVGSENLLAHLQQAGADAHKDYTHDLINSQVVPSPDSNLPGVRLYREMMDKHRPGLPAQADSDYRPLPDSFVSLEGFLNARLLTEVLDQLGDDPRRDAIPKTAESIEDFKLGIAAPAAFGAGRRQAMDHVYYTVASAKDGQFVRLKDDEWRERWGR